METVGGITFTRICSTTDRLTVNCRKKIYTKSQTIIQSWKPKIYKHPKTVVDATVINFTPPGKQLIFFGKFPDSSEINARVVKWDNHCVCL